MRPQVLTQVEASLNLREDTEDKKEAIERLVSCLRCWEGVGRKAQCL